MDAHLKRQIAVLESDNRGLREQISGGVRSLGLPTRSDGGQQGVDSTIQQFRADLERGHAAHAAREEELVATAERLRKEALAAKLRERTALEEMAEAKEHLTEQREKFSSARQVRGVTFSHLVTNRSLTPGRLRLLLAALRQLHSSTGDAASSRQLADLSICANYLPKLRKVRAD